MQRTLELFWTFFKIGFFTFGGGLAMLPFIENEFVSKKKWVTPDEMTEMVALAQSFPGVIAINVSILIGHHVARLKGSIAAIIGTILPALLSIVLILTVLQGFENQPIVHAVFVGIKAASAALILDTVLRMIRSTLHNRFEWTMGGIALVIVMLNYSAAWSILVGAIAGLIYFRKRKEV